LTGITLPLGERRILRLLGGGQAQDAGALGDTINVMNTQSKRMLQGVVVGAGRVTVAALPSRVVESAPAAVAPASPSAESLQPERKVE
jgi:hypothetical protein